MAYFGGDRENDIDGGGKVLLMPKPIFEAAW